MPSRLNPYLNFNGDAREAMEFYRSVFGGEIKLMTYAEGGMASQPGDAGRIMHGELHTPAGYSLMGADRPSSGQHRPGNTMTVSVSGDGDDLRRYWDGLSVGASITEPLATAPWGDTFGMLTDRFGVAWMFSISPAAKA